MVFVHLKIKKRKKKKKDEVQTLYSVEEGFEKGFWEWHWIDGLKDAL